MCGTWWLICFFSWKHLARAPLEPHRLHYDPPGWAGRSHKPRECHLCSAGRHRGMEAHSAPRPLGYSKRAAYLPATLTADAQRRSERSLS